MSDHPSYLELDRSALGLDASAARAHVASCERCRHYVERLEAREAPPAWLRQLAPARARRPWWLAGGFAFAAATAVLVLVLSRSDRGPEPEYTTVKGAPSVAVHVKRGEDVFIWDGVEPVIPGDRIRLEVAANDHRRVQVRTAGDQVLFDAPLPDTGSLLLPTAWEVDAQPGAEVLDVLLTDARGGVWRTTLTLPKQTEGMDR